MEAAVIVRFTETGELDYLVSPDARVRLFIVDERCPNDRVFEWTRRVEPAAIVEMLGNSEIGHSKDERHPAIAHVIEAYMDGRPRLSVVFYDS
jgi:hypothetical protein